MALRVGVFASSMIGGKVFLHDRPLESPLPGDGVEEHPLDDV